MAKHEPEVRTPKATVKMTEKPAVKPNGAARFADPQFQASGPVQPANPGGVIGDIKVWEKKLVDLAVNLKDDLVKAGAEPGGLIYLVWAKDGGFRVKILPSEMKVANAAAILRGLAAQMEQQATLSKPVGELIDEAKTMSGRPNG